MGAARERLTGRLGFILLSAACAIGIGNVWRFPYVAGSSGGGWFVIFYLVCLFALGLPVLLMEFATGRAAGCSIVAIHSRLTPHKPLWRVHGIAGALSLSILMTFYTVVAAWMAIYFWKFAVGDSMVTTAQEAADVFRRMRENPWPQAFVTAGVCAVALAICAVGLRNGLERCTKWMMLSLLVLIVALAARTLSLDGALDGLKFYLVPDTSRLLEVGLAKVLANALQQAFFTLSLGIGSMAIFGSYIGRERKLLGEGFNVVALDTFVAFFAGLVVLPASSAFGVDYAAGPELVFVVLPNVFCRMAGGRFWGAIFFLFLGFAAFSTVLAVFEGIVASVCDYMRWGRIKACVALALAMPVFSLPCVFGFNLWRDFHPLGGESTILDFEDFLVSDLALPLGSLAFVVYCTNRCGWGWQGFLDEANAGCGRDFPRVLRWYCAYCLPVMILAVSVIGLWRRFCH